MATNPFLEIVRENEARGALGRRTFLKVAAAGGVGAVLYDQAFAGIASWARAASAGQTAASGTAKRCVFVYLAGGPSHIDTFDPKPGHANGGEFKAIESAVSGIRISEHLPELAKEMKDLCIVRSMFSKEGNHDRGRYLVHTGYAPQALVAHPPLGSVLSHELADGTCDLPAFISVNGASFPGGYFGTQHSPFVVQRATRPIEDLGMSNGMTAERFDSRRKLLKDLDTRFAKKTGSAAVEPHQQIYDRAVKLMRSPLLAAFEVAKEAEPVQASYGKEDFGQGMLMARRLLEAGVTCVEVTLNGWDTHQNNFAAVKKLSDTLDRGVASLIRDLRSRGMLKDTLVMCLGEFGRTPKINNGGRDHWPRAWSALLAGGGVKGGQVYGSTTEGGEEPKDQPVAVADLFFTVAKHFGVDPTQTNFAGPRPITLVDKAGKYVPGIFG